MIFHTEEQAGGPPRNHKHTALTWLILALYAAVAAPQSQAAESLRSYIEDGRHRQAYGLYIQKKKLGWAIDELKLGTHQGREAAVQSFEMKGSFRAGGETADFTSRSTVYFSLEGDGAILEAEEVSNENGRETRRQAIPQAGGTLLITKTEAGETRRIGPALKENLKLVQQLDTWLSNEPKKGAKFESWSTMLDQDEVNALETYVYRGSKTILWGGVRTEVFLVRVQMEGMDVNCEVTSDGTLISGMIGGLMELRAETETVAKQTGDEPIDLLGASNIVVDKRLGDSEQITFLRLRIRGLGDFAVPVSHRQKIASKRRDSQILELSRDFRVKQSAPLPDAERRKNLESTGGVQSDHPQIVQKALEIAGTGGTSLEKAERLQKWVHGYVRQRMAANASTALEVLNSRAGDCTEITLLFVSLCRAIGIPAREVGGVMYVDDERPIFGWHAWAEIHDGGRWVSIDPTWDQVYVDATHLKLADGTDDWAWVNLLGRVKIEILDFKRK
jgi:hypothetical protein